MFNAFDTLILERQYKNDFVETFQQAFVPGHLEAEVRVEGLREQIKALSKHLGILENIDFDALFRAADQGKFNLNKLLEIVRDEL